MHRLLQQEICIWGLCHSQLHRGLLFISELSWVSGMIIRTLVALVLRWLRQESHKYQASMNYRVGPSLEKREKPNIVKVDLV